jgi:chitinase
VKRLFVILWLLLLPVLLISQTTSTMTIVLAWDPNTEPDLAGYHVYWGNASAQYGAFKATVPVMPAPTYTTPVLPNGLYYFAVTAFNTAGLESGFSNEVSATIASAPAAPTNLKKK